MQFNKKLIQFFKSWRYLDFNAKNSTILMGYQGEDLLKYFDLDAENIYALLPNDHLTLK